MRMRIIGSAKTRGPPKPRASRSRTIGVMAMIGSSPEERTASGVPDTRAHMSHTSSGGWVRCARLAPATRVHGRDDTSSFVRRVCRPRHPRLGDVRPTRAPPTCRARCPAKVSAP
jgi:hypothetical protein